MPFESKAQQRFMFAKHPEMAKEWADKTPDISALPEHAKKMADGGTPEEGNWVHNPDAPSLPEVGKGMKEGINHDSDAVKSYLSSKFAQMLHPGMGEDMPQTSSTQPPFEIGKTPTTEPPKMADGGFPHVTFMEDQTPAQNKETTHLAKSHEEPKMAKGGFLEGLKKGALHKEMGISEDKKIPAKKLEHAADSDNETLRKRAQFAINAKKWHHAAGGVIPHEEKLKSIYKAMGIKNYDGGGSVTNTTGDTDPNDVDPSQLPAGVPPPPPTGDPSYPGWLNNFLSKMQETGSAVGGALNNAIPTMPAVAEGAAKAASAPGIAPTINSALGTNLQGPDIAPTPTPAPTPNAASPQPSTVSPQSVHISPLGVAPTSAPNIGNLFNQDTSKLTQGVNPEDRQALANQLQTQQHGLGAVIAEAVSGLGDALAAKGGREQHSLQNIFGMQKQQRDEALANFDQARQDRIQKLALQTQMGQNGIQQLAAQDAYGTDEHLNKMLGAPPGTAHKDLPLYFQMKSAAVAQQEKNADLYIKAHAQAANDVDNSIKNASALGFKPSAAQIQARVEQVASKYVAQAKGLYHSASNPNTGHQIESYDGGQSWVDAGAK